MMVNIGTAVAPVNIAFSSSRSTALYEGKILHYTTVSMKIHYCTLSEIKTQVYTLSDVLALCLITLRGPKTTLKPRLLNKIFR